MDEKELNPQLKKYLSSLQEIPARDPQQRMQGRAQFLQQAESKVPQAVPSLWERISAWLGSFRGVPRKRWATALAGLAAALFFTLASVGGTVYASQASLPGDALYPVKTLVENVQLGLENDPEDRIQLYSSFAHRRIQEIQIMIERGEGVPPSALTRLEEHTGRMVQETAALRERELELALHQILFNLQEQSQALETIQKDTPEEAGSGLEQAKAQLQKRLDLINGALEHLDGNHQKIQQGGPEGGQGSGKPENPGQNNPGRPETDHPGGKPENPGNGQGGANQDGPSGSPDSPGEDPTQDDPQGGQGPQDNGRDH